MSVLPQLDRVFLADRAYKEIKEAILEGNIEVGAKLTEAGFAKQLGVSRVPVREALQRLRNDGLLVDSGQRGMTVRKLTAADVVDIYNFRLGLEPVAARIVATHRGRPEILDARIQEMAQAADWGEMADLNAAELSFHQDLCELAGNPLIISSFSRVAAQIRLAIILDNLQYLDIAHVAEEHVKVVDALESGDPDVASQTVVEHILSTVKHVIAALEESTGETGASERLAWRPK